MSGSIRISKHGNQSCLARVGSDAPWQPIVSGAHSDALELHPADRLHSRIGGQSAIGVLEHNQGGCQGRAFSPAFQWRSARLGSVASTQAALEWLAACLHDKDTKRRSIDGSGVM